MRYTNAIYTLLPEILAYPRLDDLNIRPKGMILVNVIRRFPFIVVDYTDDATTLAMFLFL